MFSAFMGEQIITNDYSSVPNSVVLKQSGANLNILYLSKERKNVLFPDGFFVLFLF